MLWLLLWRIRWLTGLNLLLLLLRRIIIRLTLLNLLLLLLRGIIRLTLLNLLWFLLRRIYNWNWFNLIIILLAFSFSASLRFSPSFFRGLIIAWLVFLDFLGNWLFFLYFPYWLWSNNLFCRILFIVLLQKLFCIFIKRDQHIVYIFFVLLKSWCKLLHYLWILSCLSLLKCLLL